MNPSRRNFWKFLAAAPAAAIAPLVVTPKELPEISGDAITIEGGNVTVSNVRLEGSINIKSSVGAPVSIHGAYITPRKQG